MTKKKKPAGPKAKKPAGRKPWSRMATLRQFEKLRDRMHWSPAEWKDYNDSRDARRKAPKRPRLMSVGLPQRLRAQETQRRRQRMLDYHARRRAALAAAKALPP